MAGGFAEQQEGELAASILEEEPFFWNLAASIGDGLMVWFGIWVSSIARIIRAAGDLPRIPLSVWIAGLLLVTAVHVWQALAFRSCLKGAKRAQRSTRRIVESAANRMGMRHVPDVYMVKHSAGPMIWCGRRTLMLLPIDLWSALDDIEKLAVVYHELAHLRRRDHWVCRGELIVGLLYWWHPLIWWVRHRMHEEAELCCDAWVTWFMPRDRRAYAEALLRTREFISNRRKMVPSVALGMATGRTRKLARRIRMVMTQSNRPGFSLTGVVLIATLAAPAKSCPPTESDETSTPTVAASPTSTHEQYVHGTTVQASSSDDSADAYHPAVENYALGQNECYAAVNAAQSPAAPRSHSHAHSRGHAAPLVGKRHSSGDGDGGVEERLTRLEKRLDRLIGAIETREGTFAGPNPRRSQSGSVSRKRRPAAPRHSRGSSADFFGPRGFVGAATDPKTTRAYTLPKGKLEMLAELMVRSDVPILVQPGEDRITVSGTPAQHGIFQSFVDLIDSKDQDDTRSYALPKGKLDLLNQLMARDDVPVQVMPGEKEIGVEATPANHAIFKAFLDMIHPDRGDRSKAKKKAKRSKARKSRSRRSTGFDQGRLRTQTDIANQWAVAAQLHGIERQLAAEREQLRQQEFGTQLQDERSRMLHQAELQLQQDKIAVERMELQRHKEELARSAAELKRGAE